MKHIKLFEEFNENQNETLLNEKFMEGTASHYDSLLKKWSKKYDVQYEWKFKEIKNKQSESYFVLKLNHEAYTNLPHEAIVELNGLNKQFNVDFQYKNHSWTPIIK